MRYVAMVVAAVASILAVLAAPNPEVAFANFHCMRIHAVMGAFDGDNRVQYVELRMDVGGQNFVGGHTIGFYDAAGTLQYTFTFPGMVTNAVTGDSILVATSEFNAKASGGAADVVFNASNTVANAGGADPFHPIQWPGGKVVFAFGQGPNCGSTIPVDSVAYGGAPADYPPSAGALPSPSDFHVLRLSDLHATPSNNNASYFPLQPVATSSFSVAPGSLPTDFSTPRNNARVVLALTPPNPPCGPDVNGDGIPDCWENLYPACINPAMPAPNADPDADGLTTFQEYTDGTDPCIADTDSDGCADGREVGPARGTGGQRDPNIVWDVADVPVPALTQSQPAGTRNKLVSLADVSAVLFYSGTFSSSGNTNGNGASYITDWNGNSVPDGQEYDRTPSMTSGETWRSGPPNGAVLLQDVSVALAQVLTNCN